MNGTLVCDGTAVAHHRHNHKKAGPLARQAWEYLKKIRDAGEFPLSVDVLDSRVTSIRTNSGKCILGDLLPLTDAIFHGMLIEVAFASMEALERVDWNFNSQLNEGAGGCHIALGTGVDAAHIDFISSRANVVID